MAGYKLINDFNPKFVKVGPISSQSEKRYSFVDSKGVKHSGIAQRYDRAYNAHHVQYKQGQIIFIADDNSIIKDVTHFL